MKKYNNYIYEYFHKKKYAYHSSDYKFVEILQNLYNIDDLTRLFENKNVKEVCNFKTDCKKQEIIDFYTSPLFHDFLEEYNKFIQVEMKKIFNNENFIIYQTRPTFRIHEPNNLSVGEWHRDSQEGYNHYKNTINFYLPFTEINENNTIWMAKNIHDNSNESIEPVLLDNNEFASNYLACVLHGNKINMSDKTRISVDFRIIPGSLYNEEDMINYSDSKRKLAIGDYYSFLNLK